MKTEQQDINIKFIVGDPWDFGEACNWKPLFGKVILSGTEDNNKNESILIKLDKQILIAKSECQYFVASARYSHDIDKIVRLLKSGNEVHCNLTCIPKTRAVSENPLNLQWWRGGIAAIGVLKKN